MTQSQLLEKIRTGHILFKSLLAELSSEQMIQPGVIGEWSVKDIVAHIVVHEQRMLAWMTERWRGEIPHAPQPYAMPDNELDQLNEQIFRENRDRALLDILNGLDKTHVDILAFVAATDEQDLIDPQRFHLQDGEPLWEAVAANTCDHYAQHGADIRQWRE